MLFVKEKFFRDYKKKILKHLDYELAFDTMGNYHIEIIEFPMTSVFEINTKNILNCNLMIDKFNGNHWTV